MLEGFTLRQRFEQQKKFAPQQILQILGGVCAGLQAAHENGLVHRDLKPENIFLAQSGEGEVPKILDFGLAKFLVSTVNSAACYSRHSPRCADGTPQYMSPDHLKGDVASAVWDIWALAVITYEMLTGAHPFPAGSVGQTHYAIVSGGFTPLSTHLPDAPAEWQQFFERALSHPKPRLDRCQQKNSFPIWGRRFAWPGRAFRNKLFARATPQPSEKGSAQSKTL